MEQFLNVPDIGNEYLGIYFIGAMTWGQIMDPIEGKDFKEGQTEYKFR